MDNDLFSRVLSIPDVTLIAKCSTIENLKTINKTSINYVFRNR